MNTNAKMVSRDNGQGRRQAHNDRRNSASPKAFTLIELLIVIAIIAILAAMIFPVTGAVNRAKIRNRTKGEMRKLETSIELYKSRLGTYPPSDTNNIAVAPLYFELLGTTLNNGIYSTLDNSATISAAQVSSIYGVAIGGFVNSTTPGGGDNGGHAQNFMAGGLKPGQYLMVTNGGAAAFPILGVSVDGPLIFQDVNKAKINPWRYNSVTPTNNPQSYDLWVDVLIGGKTNRICNWSETPIVLN